MLTRTPDHDKYEAICTDIYDRTEASVALVVILGGPKGDGFSCISYDPAILATLPAILENVAAEIRNREKHHE